MVILADQIDDYFEKDHDRSLVIHSFNYWCKLVGIYYYKLVYGIPSLSTSIIKKKELTLYTIKNNNLE